MAYRECLLSKAVKHEGDEGEEDDTEVIVACISITCCHPYTLLHVQCLLSLESQESLTGPITETKPHNPEC